MWQPRRFYALFVKAYYRNVIIIYFYVNKVYDKVQKSVKNIISLSCDCVFENLNAKNNNPLYGSAAHRHDEATIAYFSDRKLLSYKTFCRWRYGTNEF